MQAHLVVLPPPAEFLCALSNLDIRIDDEERAAAIGIGSNRQRWHIKRAQPVVHLGVVTALKPAVVMVNHSATTITYSARF